MLFTNDGDEDNEQRGGSSGENSRKNSILLDDDYTFSNRNF